MDFLDNTEDVLDNNSSDYSDEEYEYIDYDTIEFDLPKKNKENIYSANLDEKIILELDNLDIFEIINEEGNTFVIFNLDLDNEDHNELIEILYNLDEKALEKCLEHSQSWFNKTMTERDVENLYIPLYIDNYKQKGHVLMKVKLDEQIDINKLNITNINIIEIKGLVFYKKTFLYHIVLKEILEETINLIDNINTPSQEKIATQDKQDSATPSDHEKGMESIQVLGGAQIQPLVENDLNLNTLLNERDKNIETTSDKPATLDVTPDEEHVHTHTHEPNDEGNDEGNDEPNDEPNDEGNDEGNDVKENVEKKTMKENVKKTPHKKIYKELLERKRLEVQQSFIESEKKNKEAEDFRIKAIESANELRQIEEKGPLET